MSIEETIDKFMLEVLPLTTKLDNGLLKTQLCTFLEWLKNKEHGNF